MNVKMTSKSQKEFLDLLLTKQKISLKQKKHLVKNGENTIKITRKKIGLIFKENGFWTDMDGKP